MKLFTNLPVQEPKRVDLHAGEFHTPTRLDGYIWVANTSKISHVPNDEADDVDMEEDDENETQASNFCESDS